MIWNNKEKDYEFKKEVALPFWAPTSKLNRTDSAY